MLPYQEPNITISESLTEEKLQDIEAELEGVINEVEGRVIDLETEKLTSGSRVTELERILEVPVSGVGSPRLDNLETEVTAVEEDVENLVTKILAQLKERCNAVLRES